MSETYLHGVKVIEVDNGVKAITIADTSIIGLVGTAPDAEAGTAATLTIGSSTSALTFTAVATGAEGNDISIAIVNPATASQALSVTLDTLKITISLATDEDSAITSTAAEIKTALDADTDIAALIATTSGGSGVVSASSEKYLTGGEDEAFPLNTPVKVTPNNGLASRAGTAGSIYYALNNIWNQADAVVVVVRVAQTTNDANAATIAAVAGDLTARTGVYALLKSKSITALKPKILIAPGFTQEQSVLTNFIAVANKLRGMIYADGPNTNDNAAIEYGGQFDAKRVVLTDPKVKISRSTGIVTEFNSSCRAGIRAGLDNAEGFWTSSSNESITGIVGTSRAIDFAMGDTTSAANLLNEANVATIIHENGYRFWGSRTLSSDSSYAFEHSVRIDDAIAEMLQDNFLWAVDNNITKNFLNSVAESVNTKMRDLIAEGALIGPQSISNLCNCCVPNAELNTEANLAAGKVYFDVYHTDVPIAEQITFRTIKSTVGLESLAA